MRSTSIMKPRLAWLASLSAGVATAALAQTPPPAAAVENDGTDPTQPLSQVRFAFEHLDLQNGLASDRISAEYTRPLGDGSWTIRPKVEFAALNVPGDASFDVGDISLKLTKVVARNRRYGIATSLELLVPTAGKDFLGGGKWVAKPSLTYAIFLKGGHIFAPTLVHAWSFAGDNDRPDVNVSTFDFYFVPRLANRKLFMTVDPAVNLDWETGRDFGALAVTMGYKLGPMLGGRGQVSVKPSVGIGSNAPQDWGVQIAFQLLGL
jgi:hypothetical protein